MQDHHDPRPVRGAGAAGPGETGKAVVFVSYSKSDRVSALQVKAAVEAAGLEAWMFEDKIGGASPYSAVADQIDEAAAFVLVLSLTSKKSKWIKYEAELAVAQYIERQMPVVVVRIEEVDCPAILKSFTRLNWSGVNPDGAGELERLLRPSIPR